MFGKVVKKVKAAIPKAVSAVKKTVKKGAELVKKSVKAVVSAVPKVVKQVEKTTTTVKKLVATIPKAIKSTGKKARDTAKKKVEEKAQPIKEKLNQVKDKVEKKKEDVLEDLADRNKRILEKVSEEWKRTVSGLERGSVTIGARAFNLPTTNDFKMLDFVFQARKAVLEEYPTMNWMSNGLKGAIETVKDTLVSGGQAYGSFLYDLNMPIVSDYAGAFFDVREGNAKSSLGSVFGSLAKGVIVDGLGGTIEGVAHMAADPIGTLEGINTILAYPEETLPAILDGVKEVWNEKVIKGSPEDRANLLGQAGFEIASWLVGAGEAKAASTVAKTGKTAQLIKTTDKVNEVSRVAKVANVTTDLARYKAGLTALGKDIAKGLDSKILEGARKFGNSFDQVRYNMNRLTLSMQPQLAGIGNL